MMVRCRTYARGRRKFSAGESRSVWWHRQDIGKTSVARRRAEAAVSSATRRACRLAARSRSTRPTLGSTDAIFQWTLRKTSRLIITILQLHYIRFLFPRPTFLESIQVWLGPQ